MVKDIEQGKTERCHLMLTLSILCMFLHYQLLLYCPKNIFCQDKILCRAQSADCALTQYGIPAKCASSQYILSRHHLLIFLHFVPTQYGIGRQSSMDEYRLTVYAICSLARMSSIGPLSYLLARWSTCIPTRSSQSCHRVACTDHCFAPLARTTCLARALHFTCSLPGLHTARSS